MNRSKKRLIKKLFTGDQHELCKKLRAEAPTATEYKNNLYSFIDPGAPVFIAHMDTVGEPTMTKPLNFSGDILSRPGYVLGADDRAGVYLIWSNRHKINWILTTDEEIGGKGAEALTADPMFREQLQDYDVPCGIVLDRRGRQDIIGSYNYYCEYDLEDKIEKLLPGYHVAMGLWSDADIFSRLIPCVNLSVGYENAHSTKEYLDLQHLEWLEDQIIPLSSALTGESFELPSNPYGQYGIGCDICGDFEDPLIDLSNAYGLVLCESCAEELRTTLTEQLRLCKHGFMEVCDDDMVY